MSIVSEHNPECLKIIEHFRTELGSLRTGRAHPALLDSVMVNAYGTKTPLRQLGAIAVADAHSLTVEPWDKSLLKEVEKGIAEANLGLGTADQGSYIRVNVPAMTEETRKELAKLLKQKAETARISLRGLRDTIKETVTAAEKDKSITEDERYRLQKELDTLVSSYTDQIKTLAESKEAEIMTV
ncbi:ribosome recycling factor [Candidatus Falkowbacteria bacterium]|nr:ribosome recycling factor [Candidatus Falkowbacteria bacterium]